jgi:hypothetical protein
MMKQMRRFNSPDRGIRTGHGNGFRKFYLFNGMVELMYQ